jgi:hypothetical protein
MTWKPNYTPKSGKPVEETSQALWHNGLDVYLQKICWTTHQNHIDGEMLTENFFSSRRFAPWFNTLNTEPVTQWAGK